MPFAGDDDMVETFPPDRADQPFRMSVLPWRAWRGWPVSNIHGTKLPGKNLAIDRVAIADDVPRHRLPAAGLGKLPGHPFSTRVCRHPQP